MADSVGAVEVALSLVLVAVAIGLSLWLRLAVERSIVWASARAAVQLIGVGLVFMLIFDSAGATAWAWLWVVGMVVVASAVVQRRARDIPGLRWTSLAAIGGSTAVTLAIVFGLGVLDLDPVTLVVIAGIGIGNTLPAAVLAADRLATALDADRRQIEGLLALGFDAAGASRFVAANAARVALIPQIERTKVVGLIALPGAMTGLLLAGVDPLDAVLVQLIVMYLILGSVAVAVVIVTAAGARQAFTPDLRLRLD